MPTFLFQNYQMIDKYLTSKTTFSKKVNPIKYPVQTYLLVGNWNLLFMYFPGVSHFSKKLNLIKYPVQTYMLVRNWNLLFMYFPGVSQQIMKSILNVKKVLSDLVIISALHSLPKKFLFFLEFLCSISSSHFLPFNFMCAFNR